MVRSNHGFTLIELMVVVIIIGLLAAIAIPNYISMQERSREAGVKSNMHAIQTGMEAYATTSGGVYPVGANALTSLVTQLPASRYPDNPYTRGQTVVNWDQGVNSLVLGQTAVTNVMDSLGVAIAFTSAGEIHVSSGFSDEIPPYSTSYAITGNAKFIPLIDKGNILLNFHN